MKPFDLQRALAGDKVVTRDGSEVTQLNKFKCEGFCIAGVVEDQLQTWAENGKALYGEDSPEDLFMAPKTVKRWVNFYPSGHASVFYDEEEAKLRSAPSAIAIAVPVEFEEGYGVDHE